MGKWRVVSCCGGEGVIVVVVVGGGIVGVAVVDEGTDVIAVDVCC